MKKGLINQGSFKQIELWIATPWEFECALSFVV
jgi:hypothetical protein